MDYRSRKSELAKRAIENNKNMQVRYGENIKSSIARTKVYERDFKLEMSGDLPSIEIADLDSVSAIHKYSSENMAVLNFASYKFPGGGYMRGSSAQEEDICRHSYLYSVISTFDAMFYEWNRNHTNRGLYMNQMLYLIIRLTVLLLQFQHQINLLCFSIIVLRKRRILKH